MMKEIDKNLQDTFDFSLEAAGFQKKLWLQLKAKTLASAPLILDDDDLQWVNAAGAANERIPDDDSSLV